MEKLINQYKCLIDQLLNSHPCNFDSNLSAKLPKEGGVYRIFEIHKPDESIYIGKTKSLKRRIIGNHFKGNRVASTLKRKLIKHMGLENEKDVENYLSNKCNVQFIVIGEEKLRIGFEHFAVAVLFPKWND